MTPSELLSRAADLIRDTAAAAAPGPWTLYDRGVCWEIPELPEEHDGLSGFREVDARWVALMSPTVAGPLETLLREAAANCDRAKAEGWSDAEIRVESGADMKAAFALAEAVLGVPEETT